MLIDAALIIFVGVKCGLSVCGELFELEGYMGCIQQQSTSDNELSGLSVADQDQSNMSHMLF